jgi:hypothetical protein
MKKSIILLLGLVLLFAIPILASTSTNENAPVPTSEDQQFMGLTTLSEEELMEIIGLIAIDNIDGTNTFNPTTQMGTTSDGKKFKIIKEKDFYVAKVLSVFIVSAGLIISKLDSISDLFALLGIALNPVTVTYIAGAVIVGCVTATVVFYILNNDKYTYAIVYY